MKNKYYLLFVSVILFLIAGCTLETSPPSKCNPPFFISEQENFNKPISDEESAYRILINLESGWSQDTDSYRDYKNSKVSDVVYKEIPVGGEFEKKYAYVLKDQIAINSEGQVYRKGGCI